MTSHLVYPLLGPAVALAAAGLAGELVYGLAISEVGRQLPRVLGGAMVQLPAVWALAGVALALFGLLPRLAAGAWAAWGLVVFIWLLGTSLQLNQWLQDVSPFTHLPRLPGGQPSAAPLLWLATVTAVLVVAGVGGFRLRDIART